MKILACCSDTAKAEQLKISCERNGHQLVLIMIEWKGFYSKLFGLREAVKDLDDGELFCFVDAYDVLCLGGEEELLTKFHSFSADIVFSAELIPFPSFLQRKYTDTYYKVNEAPKTNYRYLNSGGIIGYKEAFVAATTWIEGDERLIGMCYNGTDQGYFTFYLLKHANDGKIKLDHNQIIFQSLCLVPRNEIVVSKGRVYNKVLKTQACFIHFNGRLHLNIEGKAVLDLWNETISKTATIDGEVHVNYRNRFDFAPWSQVPCEEDPFLLHSLKGVDVVRTTVFLGNWDTLMSNDFALGRQSNSTDKSIRFRILKNEFKNPSFSCWSKGLFVGVVPPNQPPPETFIRELGRIAYSAGARTMEVRFIKIVDDNKTITGDDDNCSDTELSSKAVVFSAVSKTDWNKNNSDCQVPLDEEISFDFFEAVPCHTIVLDTPNDELEMEHFIWPTSMFTNLHKKNVIYREPFRGIFWGIEKK